MSFKNGFCIFLNLELDHSSKKEKIGFGKNFDHGTEFAGKVMAMVEDDLRSKLKRSIQSGKQFLIPGVFDSLSARLAERAGFQAAYVSSIGAEGTLLAGSNRGLLSMSERARHLRYIREAVRFPLFVDAESGYGNALSTFYTAREFERSGAAAIILNDQDVPSVSSFFPETAIIGAAAMAGKIHAAIDALDDPDTVIIARTDSLSGKGMDEALGRIERYKDAGTDLVMIGGLTGRASILAAAEQSRRLPLGIEIMEGCNDAEFSAQELFGLGFRIVFYPASTLFAVAQAEEEILSTLKDSGRSAETVGGKPGFDRFNRAFDSRLPSGKKASE